MNMNLFKFRLYTLIGCDGIEETNPRLITLRKRTLEDSFQYVLVSEVKSLLKCMSTGLPDILKMEYLILTYLTFCE